MSLIRKEDIEFSFYRSSGPGGQKKNTTDSAVRLRHLPTGLVVLATSSRSQHRNKIMALEELERRLQERRKRPKFRVDTRPSRGVRERRIQAKKQRGAIKKMRRAPRMDD